MGDSRRICNCFSLPENWWKGDHVEYFDCRTCDYFALFFGCKRDYSTGVFVAESDWVFVDDWGCEFASINV